MFDARSILDAIVKGAGEQPQASARSGGAPGGFGELGDLLRQIAGGDGQVSQAPVPSRPQARMPTPQPQEPAPASEPDDEQDAPPPPRTARSRARPAPQEDDAQDPPGRQGPGSGGGGLEDIIRDVLGGNAGGGLKDILEKVQKGGGLGGLGGGLGDILGQVLGGGKPGGAAHLAGDGTATAAGPLGNLGNLGDLAGRSPEELMALVKSMLANNQFAAGAAAGGLGALVLGTRTGRSLAASAAKLGGLAAIGGLAYKAYQNYQQGVPAAGTEPHQLAAPPTGSGFEAGAVTHDHAVTMIRAMVAAAAADGRIDEAEQQKLIAGLGGSAMSAEAQAFLAKEIANPASIEDIAAAVTSEEEAVQVYTAARITVDPSIAEEHDFLAALAERLGLDEGLTAHVDATARTAA